MNGYADQKLRKKNDKIPKKLRDCPLKFAKLEIFRDDELKNL